MFQKPSSYYAIALILVVVRLSDFKDREPVAIPPILARTCGFHMLSAVKVPPLPEKSKIQILSNLLTTVGHSKQRG